MRGLHERSGIEADAAISKTSCIRNESSQCQLPELHAAVRRTNVDSLDLRHVTANATQAAHSGNVALGLDEIEGAFRRTFSADLVDHTGDVVGDRHAFSIMGNG